MPKKAKSDNINANIIEKVDKNLEPETPIKRPSKLDEKNPKNGKGCKRNAKNEHEILFK